MGLAVESIATLGERNITKSFLDPEALRKIIEDITQAEGQARQDIAVSITEAIDELQGTTYSRDLIQANAAANTAAIKQMSALSGLDIGEGAPDSAAIQANLENTPGYQFRLQQGLQAVERANSAKGLLESGAVLKDLTNYSQGLASQEYAAEQSRLASLAGLTSNIASQGLNQQGQVASLKASQGGALAAAAQSAAAQRSSALQSGSLQTKDNQQYGAFNSISRTGWL